MIEVTLPPMSAAQTQSWLTLLELGRRLPTDWTLVGGQLVFLHCQEQGAVPIRPTDDGDAALDVRARPDILHAFTSELQQMGFRADTPSGLGLQHRWRRDEAVIDVLIPRHLGERAAARRGVGGAPTIAAPGAQGALDRTETVRVTVDDQSGLIPRPTLVGAIAAKAAALEIVDDPSWRRHVQDLAVLSTILRRRDDFSSYTGRDIERVRNAIGRAAVDRSIVALIDDAEAGMDRLRLALRTEEERRSRPRQSGREG